MALSRAIRFRFVRKNAHRRRRPSHLYLSPPDSPQRSMLVWATHSFFFKNGRDTKGNIIYQLKIIPGLKDVHNVANVHPSDISARDKVHLTRKITKIIDESQVMRVVKRSGTGSPQTPSSSGQACHRQRLQRCRQSRGLQAPAPVDICSNGKECLI